MSFYKMSSDEKPQKPFLKFDPTPQPHFIPGYTGFCPDIPLTVGASYARTTNIILQEQPNLAERLASIANEVAHPANVEANRQKELESEKQLINSRFLIEGRRILGDYMMNGYTGHVPNIKDSIGVSFSRGCVTAVAKFIRDQAEIKKDMEDNL